MPTTAHIAETDEGHLELKGNELRLKDKTSGDPVAWRALSANGGIMKLSICTENDLEIGYLFGKRDERYPGQNIGQFEFWLKAPGMGAADKKVMTIGHDGITTGPVPRMVSPNGKYILNVQDDGNLVLLDTHNSADESTWTPIWSIF